MNYGNSGNCSVTFLSGGRNNRIQQFDFLFGRTVQFLNVSADHVRMDAGGSLRQFPFSFFCFRIMDNDMDRGISFDVAHLPDNSIYAKEVVRYHLLFD